MCVRAHTCGVSVAGVCRACCVLQENTVDSSLGDLRMNRGESEVGLGRVAEKLTETLFK